MSLWGKKQPTVHTNAPRHWPAIEGVDLDGPAGLLMIGAQLAALHKSPASTIAFMRDYLYDDGILRVPIEVQEGTQKTCVFIYPKVDDKAAAHFSGVRQLLRARENAAAVYYGMEAITPVKPGEVLQPIDTPFFSKAKDKDAAFALWWATDEAPKFTGSEEKGHLDRWFEALDGYGWVLFSSFLRVLELVEEEKNAIYGLPNQPLLQAMTGPGETAMLLHASVAEGLFLAFDEATPVARRRVVLRLLADFAVNFRKAIDAQKLAARPEEKGPGLATWRAIRDDALAKEAAGGAGMRLHGITVRDGQPMRSPAATTVQDRAQQVAPPGREELDFGMDLVDRIVERLKSQPVTGSTQTQLGMPNFSPVIAVKVGADVFERHLRFEDVPVAQAAAGRVLDDWPDAEIVAVAADGAVRENDKRVDIFDVKVENRKGGGAGALFQRYRVSAGGAIELIGNPTAMPAERFVLESAAVREPAPEAGLIALAQQALDSIVTSLTILEPSGMCSDDPEGVLFSPSALVGKAGDAKPLTCRFMLQGPITAAQSCFQSLQDEPAEWVAFHIDDLVSKNGAPDRRLRLCVQRRQDQAMAIFDQHYEAPRKGTPFTKRGGLQFRRWTGSMFPAAG